MILPSPTLVATAIAALASSASHRGTSVSAGVLPATAPRSAPPQATAAAASGVDIELSRLMPHMLSEARAVERSRAALGLPSGAASAARGTFEPFWIDAPTATA
ncbi:hypothetical protein LPJ61_006224 [Coemansia biformis]|uniref:Uncharacterized protein n=1 Tax=Coemansia biformis TaxID=1286918 RepID=A0A9W8CNX9_9FUNG|nr:hypothetical protein LPJ61_006224 [Coemansia biformis]